MGGTGSVAAGGKGGGGTAGKGAMGGGGMGVGQRGEITGQEGQTLGQRILIYAPAGGGGSLLAYMLCQIPNSICILNLLANAHPPTPASLQPQSGPAAEPFFPSHHTSSYSVD